MSQDKCDVIRAFQFHEGPIKTNLLALTLLTMTCFNSMKVRLKRERAATDKLVEDVSIP